MYSSGELSCSYGFKVKIENKRFIAMCSRCRQHLKFQIGDFTLYRKGNSYCTHTARFFLTINKQLLDEVEHDIMNYQNRGLCCLPKRKAEADNTDTTF